MHNSKLTRRAFLSGAAGLAALAGTACTTATGGQSAATGQPATTVAASRVDELLGAMTLDQKLAQLVMPALRSWNEVDITDLDAAAELAEALGRHQYGGVILFGANVKDTDQTLKLVNALQANNVEAAQAAKTTAIPYFVAADQEGGSVARLSMGTRGTGSMAIGATGAAAEENARTTGQIFGEELAALGINVNLGPCADIITDLSDPGMSTRLFSDDPDVVTRCSLAFGKAAAANNVVTCYKHFPGAGDGSDDPTATHLTLEQLRKQGLAAFTALIDDGVEMLMTAATTFPDFDDEQTMADGSKGYYPATCSPRIIGKLLREELGYQGVVMTDALEMEQFVTEPTTGAQLFAGEPHGVDSQVNIAVACLQAGCDILLLPWDLRNADVASKYDDYFKALAQQVKDGKLSEERIDESVRRILALKEARGVLALGVKDGKELEESITAAQAVVGSADHHTAERKIAENAVTLLKDEGVLPLPGEGVRVVILGRTSADATPISYALSELQGAGALDANAFVDDRIAGQTRGDKSARTQVYVDKYYDLGESKLVWTDDISQAIAQAQYVVCMTATWAGLKQLQDADGRMQGIGRALSEAHAAGAKFVLLSNNLPVDAARFPEADAIVCTYLSSGYDVDPTGGSGSEHMRAINANAPAGLRALWGAGEMGGKLPIDVYAMEQSAEGAWNYTSKVLYPRGSGKGSVS